MIITFEFFHHLFPKTQNMYFLFMRCEYHLRMYVPLKVLIDCDHKMWVGSMVSSWQWSLSSGLAKNSSTLFCYCYSLISYYFLGPFFQFKCQQKVICLKGIIGICSAEKNHQIRAFYFLVKICKKCLENINLGLRINFEFYKKSFPTNTLQLDDFFKEGL